MQGFCQYTVPSFDIGTRTIPQSGNEVIIPFQGTMLLQVNGVEQLKPGEFLLRRRFSASQHGLFTGKINESAYTKLSVFRQPAGITLQTATGFKFYSQEMNNPDLDLPNVYFDNEFVYVENAARLFYYDKSWKILNMLIDRPAFLSVNSEPQGAQVYIDNVLKGITPWQSGPLFSTTAVVQTRKDGYYIQEIFVNLQGGVAVSKNFILTKKVTFADGSEVDSQAFTAENTESVEELELRISELKATNGEWQNKMRESISSFNQAYPALQSQDEFEKNTEFAERKLRYELQKDSSMNLIKLEWQNRINSLDKAVSKVEQYKSTVESRVYSKALPSTSLLVERYDAENERFPISFSATDAVFDFKLTGTLSIPVDVAREFKQRISQSVVMVSYRNKAIKTGVGGHSERKYYDFESIKLKFKDKEYPVTFTISFPDYLTNSRDWRLIQDEKRQSITRAEAQVKATVQGEAKKIGMVWVPGGTFLMGSNDGGIDEKPEHKVTVNGFYMDTTEVTQAEYERVMGVRHWEEFNGELSSGSNPKSPAYYVTWDDAKKYCEKVGKRLPTEAEWEYAARGGSTTKFFWGDDTSKACSYANIADQSARSQWKSWVVAGCSDGYVRIAPVASLKANAYGLYDMTGNVWEWCSDWYDKNYYKNSSSNDPQGPSSGKSRVLRGGSWFNNGDVLRITNRFGSNPENRNNLNGFRCARSR